MRTRVALAFSLLLPIVAACGGDDDQGSTTGLACPVVVADADCDQTQRPFVFVHGTFGSGDNFAHVARLLGSNGFCQDRIITIEYNSLGDTPGTNGQLDAAIDPVLAATGFTPGRSRRSFAGHEALRRLPEQRSGPRGQGRPLHQLLWLARRRRRRDAEPLFASAISATRRITPRASNVTTVTLTDEDHFAVAASTRSFVELYRYLRGEDPQYTEVQCGEEMVTVEGIAESFADNVPQPRDARGPRGRRHAARRRGAAGHVDAGRQTATSGRSS